jgi:hypothetical protein
MAPLRMRRISDLMFKGIAQLQESSDRFQTATAMVMLSQLSHIAYTASDLQSMSIPQRSVRHQRICEQAIKVHFAFAKAKNGHIKVP